MQTQILIVKDVTLEIHANIVTKHLILKIKIYYVGIHLRLI